MPITNSNTIQTYYKALIEKNPAYVGLFYVGVKTTGIFCLATCRARKPKLENVTFYESIKEALQHGYRPCKICKPTKACPEMPDYAAKAMELIQIHPKQKIQDEDLRSQGIAPEKMRRWCLKHYGITFHAYQRMLRINRAYQELQEGQHVTESAFDAGYDSLSGFGYTFSKLTGRSPSKSKHKTLISMTRISTPLGPMFACATDQGICMLEFTDRRMLETEFKEIQQQLDGVILLGENDHLQQLKTELTEYFEGKRHQFDVALHAPGTPFQQSVWDILLTIPYGHTWTYLQQAQKLNKEKAIRAVASANGHNRIAIIIPCHRVIGSDGKLTGYGGGLDRKRWLLQHEQKHVASSVDDQMVIRFD